jgi:uncharacterized YigZ family protein
MVSEMYTIKNAVVTEQIINKSRFITYLFPVATEDEAKAKLEEIRIKHADATHNCYCYIVGDTANIMKFSDDGEPSGTAGVVIYNCLEKNNLTNVLAIVTRYFGGIKLGAGGLVRAYSSSTAMAVEAAEISEIIHYAKVKITCDYSNLGLVEKHLSEYEIVNKTFSQKVEIEFIIPEPLVEDLKAKLIDYTKDSILFEILENFNSI